MPPKKDKKTAPRRASRRLAEKSIETVELSSEDSDLEGGFVKAPPKKRAKTLPKAKDTDSDYDEDTAGGFVKNTPKNKGKGRAAARKAQGSSSGANSMRSTESTTSTAHTSPNNTSDEPDLAIPVPKKRNSRTIHDISSDDSGSDFQGSSDESEGEVAAIAAEPRNARGGRRRGAVDEATARSRRLAMRNTQSAALYHFHPHLETVFEEMRNEPPIEPVAIPQPEGMTIELLPFQKEGLHWLIEQEKTKYNGGILADEMGMGKTIQTIALFMSDDKEKRATPNLVLAPAVALLQWKSEIEMHSGGNLTAFVFHGTGAKASEEDILNHDVVLTTYSLLESMFRKQEYGFKRKAGLVKARSVLHNVVWHRIVLDEAHSVKSRHSNTSRAVSNLHAEKRLCLSGTPLQNRVGEIYSLIRFLQVDPFCQYFCRKCPCVKSTWNFTGTKCDDCGHFYGVHHNFFNYSILYEIQRPSDENSGNSMSGIRLLLKKIMLRRTKTERADDLGLPPRIVEIRRDYFNPEEKDLYDSIYSDSTRKFNTYVAQGVVLNNYANIFSLITRMRQMADHPDLVLKRHMANKGYVQNTLICKLCDDPAEEPIESKCHHTFCRLCITEYTESWSGDLSALECPVCHIGLSIDLTGPAIVPTRQIEEVSSSTSKNSIINRINMSGGWHSSTKIEGLVEELYKLRSNKQTIKSIVFSQFTSMLDLVEWRLNKAGFQTVKLQGSMSPTQRDAIIKHFMSTPSVEIFLVSLKAGGVALNLCEASQVFILDPWWNPSVEWQSGDRVHRIGQHRPVKITRLIIQDSIESRIVELQEKKTSMINATIDADDAAMQRLTTADVQFLFHN